jgi:hypothetical protein
MNLNFPDLMKQKKWVVAFLLLFVSSSISLAFPFSSSDRWINIEFEKDSFKTNALLNDLYFPDYKKNGKIKFLEDGKGLNIGYLIDVNVESLDISKIPKKYLIPKELVINGQKITQLPTSSVTFDISITFTLLDKDGFEVDSVKTQNISIQSGSNGKPLKQILQGKVGNVTKEKVKKVAKVKSQITFEKCVTCN